MKVKKNIAVLVRARSRPRYHPSTSGSWHSLRSARAGPTQGAATHLGCSGDCKSHPTSRRPFVVACLPARAVVRPYLKGSERFGRREPEATILELIADQERFSRLSLSGRQRAARCVEILKQASLQAARVPIRRLTEAAWLSLGGPACLTRESHREDVEVLFALLDELDEGGVVRDFSLVDQRLTFLFAKPATGRRAGADYDDSWGEGAGVRCGFLPQLHRGTPPASSPLLVWAERPKPRWAARAADGWPTRRGENDAIYTFVKKQAQRRSKSGDGRLLYVAASARTKLFLSGAAEKKADGSYRVAGGPYQGVPGAPGRIDRCLGNKGNTPTNSFARVARA